MTISSGGAATASKGRLGGCPRRGKFVVASFGLPKKKESRHKSRMVVDVAGNTLQMYKRTCPGCE